LDPIYGKTMTARTTSGLERWTFRANGFFDWNSYASDGTVVQRTGTYQLSQGRVSLDFRETRTSPSGAAGAPSLATSMGKAVVDVALSAGGGLIVDGVEHTNDLTTSVSPAQIGN
jgi:hypothetical protein